MNRSALFWLSVIFALSIASTVAFLNCGNYGIVRDGAPPIVSKDVPPPPPVDGTPPPPPPPPPLPCHDVPLKVEFGGYQTWNADFTLQSGESKKFCFDTTKAAPLSAEIHMVSGLPGGTSLTSVFIDQNGKAVAGRQEGDNHYAGHSGSVIGKYALVLTEAKQGRPLRLKISQSQVDTTGMCANGVVPLQKWGEGFQGPYFQKVQLVKGSKFSWCFDIPEEVYAIDIMARNSCSAPGGSKRLLLRHTNVEKYPNVVSEQISGEGRVGLTQIAGPCGWTAPGCRDRVPAGRYELRAEGLSDECTEVNLPVGLSWGPP